MGLAIDNDRIGGTVKKSGPILLDRQHILIIGNESSSYKKSSITQKKQIFNNKKKSRPRFV